MADEGKEFPDDFDPVPTPLTGAERLLVEKGTATIDDIKAFARTNLPAPSAASDAATKGYVDARPGAEEWSEHAATQDVDLDGHKLTGLGEPTDAADAANKDYVDSKVAAWSALPASTNIDANGKRIVSLGDPNNLGDAATKGYVDSIAGLAASIAEGELPLTRDTGNDVNVSAAAAGPLRFTRIGRTVTLSGLIQLTADSAGAATAAFTGIAGAALPATNNTWRGIITDQTSGATKNLNIMVYAGASGFRYTVVGAEAGASYRISFVMAYRSAA